MGETLATPTPASHRRVTDESARRLARRYGDALRAADPAGASRVVEEALVAGVDPVLVGARVIAPAMVWIGELWRRGAITVADEHLATAISEACLARLYPPLLRNAGGTRGTVVVSGVEGERHVLGARMASDVLEGAGFRSLFLGADVPTSALALAAAGHEAAAVCLSLYMPLGAPRLDAAIAAVQEARPEAKIVLAGRGVPERLRALFPFVEATDELISVLDAALQADEQPRVRPARVAERRASVTIEPVEPVEPALEERIWATAAATADLARESAREGERYRRLAFEDPLTRLPNRRAWEDELAERDGRPGMLLMLDVDRFKRINDELGHEAGDRALRHIAEVLQRRLRPTDFAARIGGDEFAVLLPATTRYEATCIAERIRAAVDAETERRLTVSIGVGEYTGDARAAALAADGALYAAKASGRNVVSQAP